MSKKWNCKHVQIYLKQMNVNVALFVTQVVVRMMCPVSGAKRLMLTYTLNLTLNIVNIVNKSKCEIKIIFTEAAITFCLAFTSL